MIIARIDPIKINDELLIVDNNGKRCLSLTLIGKKSIYGDGYIVQTLTKDQRQAGMRSQIVGNWKEFFVSQNAERLK